LKGEKTVESNFLKIMDDFDLSKFKKTYWITLLFLGIGIILYFLLLITAFVTGLKSFFFLLVHNTGMILCFTSVLLGYASVYSLTKHTNEIPGSITILEKSFKYVPYILLTSFILTLGITLIILIELGLSTLGLIPKAGPFIVSLLTLPMFLVNLFCTTGALVAVVVIPPIVVESATLRDLVSTLKSLMKERWLSTLSYVIISCSLLALCLMVIYYISGHAIGVTKAIQWNVGLNYPKALEVIAMKSFFSDIARNIAPEAEKLGLMGSYKIGPFTYSQWLKYIISAGYIIGFSLIISFPLSVYFKISSLFFRRFFSKSQGN